jgi:hypothetical protein
MSIRQGSYAANANLWSAAAKRSATPLWLLRLIGAPLRVKAPSSLRSAAALQNRARLATSVYS